jgi:hypothetical protein
MSDREWATTRGGRSALALLTLSALLCAWTLARAIRIAPVPELPVPQFTPSAALATPAPASDVDVDAAVETDPFAPDRRAPAQRYRVPKTIPTRGWWACRRSPWCLARRGPIPRTVSPPSSSATAAR